MTKRERIEKLIEAKKAACAPCRDEARSSEPHSRLCGCIATGIREIMAEPEPQQVVEAKVVSPSVTPLNKYELWQLCNNHWQRVGDYTTPENAKFEANRLPGYSVIVHIAHDPGASSCGPS
jgi:hypothetical protein